MVCSRPGCGNARRDGKRWGRLSASSNVEKVGTVCSKPPTESDAIVADARAIDGLDDGPAADDSRIRDSRDGATRAETPVYMADSASKVSAIVKNSMTASRNNVGVLRVEFAHRCSCGRGGRCWLHSRGEVVR